MTIPTDYLERVYAGILGKIIGVYLGRPFEGWTHDRILSELGPIRYYVNERLGKPLVVTDDDISGTFTFVRTLSDFGNTAGVTAAQIGQTSQDRASGQAFKRMLAIPLLSPADSISPFTGAMIRWKLFGDRTLACGSGD